MKFWAPALTTLVALPVNAYVRNWNTNIDPSETLRRLEGRADKCPSTNPVSCAAVDTKLPSSFCCPSDTICQSTDRSSSAICCPSNSDCNNIGVVSCDLSLQDASKNQGPIFTTNLTGKLPVCGDNCCPFGYICNEVNGEKVCVLDQDTAGPATTTKITSTASATITSTPTGQAAGIDSKDPPPVKEINTFPAGVFFAGFFPGILVGVLATLAWVVLSKRHTKAPNTRGLNMDGHGARPFISLPIKDARHSNERSDFLSRTRSRARSMFSTHRRSRTVDSTDFWGAKMPTPPDNNVPINYVNDMPDVPVTPARRVARYHSEQNFIRPDLDEKVEPLPVNPEVSDPLRPETIQVVYSPDLSQQQPAGPTMPQMPVAAIPPLRGMNTQRRVSPPADTIHPKPAHIRHDSGTAMGLSADRFGSPFQTPEKKPQIITNKTPSMYATYHDVSTMDSTGEPVPLLQTLTPARYDPNASATANNTLVPPSAAALAASQRLSKAQQSLPSQQRPTIPPRPQAKASKPRPETQFSDFDFDDGLEDQHSHSHSHSHSPTMSSPPREAYKSQAISNPYMQSATQQQNKGVNPNSTFENMMPTNAGSAFDGSRKDKHATNATTFTTMLRNVGFPDPGDQMPQVPKLDMSKVKGKGKGGKTKGMI